MSEQLTMTAPANGTFNVSGMEPEAANTVIDAYEQAATDPAERVAWKLRRLEVEPTAAVSADPAMPIGLGIGAAAAKIQQLVGPLADAELARMARIDNDPDLAGRAGAEIRARKHQALAAEREKAIAAVIPKFANWVSEQQAANALRPMPFSESEHAFAQVAHLSAREFLPGDFMQFVDLHLSADHSATADTLLPILKRITTAPPRHWRDSTEGQAALNRAFELVNSVKPGKRQAALLRHTRAQSAAADARQLFAAAAGNFVRHGKVSP